MNAPVNSYAGSVTIASPRTRAYTALNLAGAYALLEIALWSVQPWQTIFGIATLAWAAFSVFTSPDTTRQLGLDLRAWTRGAWMIPAGIALTVLLLLAAHALGTLHGLFGLTRPFPHGILYALWAVQQEFMLQSFMFLGFRRLMPERHAIGITAVLFSLAHIPNPALTLLTLVGGTIFTAIFARYRNLYVVGVVHAALGLSLAMAVPEPIMHHMRVGIGYYRQPSALLQNRTAAISNRVP